MSMADRPPTGMDAALDRSTLDRLDAIREDGESYDEVVNDLIDIYLTQELTRTPNSDEP